MRVAFTRRVPARGALMLLTLGFGSAAVTAQAQSTTGSGTWLDSAVAQKRCPASPVNVPAALLQAASVQDLRSRVSVVGDTLWVTGSSNPDHVVITVGGAPDTVSVSFDGQQLGTFGPVARVHVLGGDGGDVMIVDSGVRMPAILEAGAGASCLQGGSGADQLIGGAGDDVLIAGTGRPALNAGPGRNRVVAPAGMGTLWATPAADVAVTRQVSTVYTLVSPPDSSSALPGPLSPVLVGAADLQDAGTAALMRQVYAAGEAVVITDAAASDVAALGALLAHPNATTGLAQGERAAMVVFRKAPRPGTQAYDYSVAVFGQPENNGTLASTPRQPTEYTTELMSQAFAASAIVPQAPASLATAGPAASLGGSSTNLVSFANSYTIKQKAQRHGDELQAVNSVWNVRSFTNQSDFYYVLQEFDYYVGSGNGTEPLETLSDNLLLLSTPPTLLQPSPASTQCTSTTTSGVDTTVGESVGFNLSSGLDASVNHSVRISNSKTTSCPNTAIYNQSTPANGETLWVTQGSANATPNSLQTFYNQWIWEAPFSSYTPAQRSQQAISFSTNAGGRSTVYGFDVAFANVVPLPFGDTFALQAPTVASVSPTCVNAGNSFTINGAAFYPSLVTGVLIDGKPLSAQQYKVTNNASISVVAPSQSGYYLPVAVQSTLGLSNTSVTIEISTYNLCP